MKATFDFYKPVRETIKIPEEFEFIYSDDIDESEYTEAQWDLHEEWYHRALPSLLGPEASDIELWDIILD